MYLMRRWRRLLRLTVPVVSFLVAIIFLYKWLQDEVKQHHLKPEHATMIKPADDVFLHPQRQPTRWWVIAHVTEDHCLHLATTFSEAFILQYGVFTAPDTSTRHSRCHYVMRNSTETGKKLELHTEAYLYAIQRGADVIYVHPPIGKLEDVTYPAHLSKDEIFDGMMVSSDDSSFNMFNVLQHWGCNRSGEQQIHYTHHTYRLCSNVTVPVQAVVESDVENAKNIVVDESCDITSPSVILSAGTFVKIQPYSILLTKDAFWALPVWRTHQCLQLLIQKLLWLAGYHLSVGVGKTIPSTRDEHAGYFLKCKYAVNVAQCDSSDFRGCAGTILSNITTDLISEKGRSDFLQWLDGLMANNYIFPSLHKTNNKCNHEKVIYEPVNHDVDHIIKKWRPKPFPPINNLGKMQALHQHTCENSGMNTGVKFDFRAPWIIWEDVLLIVVFNNPFYDVIPYIDVLYRSFFPRMLYCGPGGFDSNSSKLHNYNISFISYGGTPVGHFPGSFNYKCVMMAVQMRYNVRGYLVIADDVLIVPQRIKDFSMEKGWFLPKKEIRTADIKALKECRLGMCDFGTRWRWWEDYQDAVIRTFKDMNHQRGDSSLVHQCLKTLVSLNHGEYHPSGAYSDIYYIPRHFAADFVRLSAIFLKHYVFLEITIPTVFRCLIPEGEMESLQGKQIWDESRNSTWLYFTKQDLVYKSYLHPTKWSYLNKGVDQYIKLFCGAVSYVHDPYGRMSKIDSL